MKTDIKASLSCLLAAAFLPACTLPPILALRPVKLKPGITYEVRKAVAAGDTFKPHLMTSYFFVIDSPQAEQPRPPLLAAGAGRPSSQSHGSGKTMTVRTTAYCHTESDHRIYGRLSALGTLLKYGSVRSAAADWSRYPAGTRFRIAGQPGVVYEVDDYGSALVGTGTIDLYKPTRGLMNDWGVRHVDIEVLSWGSYERSLQLIQARTRHPHVRDMYHGIQRRLSQASVTKTTPATAMTEPSTAKAGGLSPST